MSIFSIMYLKRFNRGREIPTREQDILELMGYIHANRVTLRGYKRVYENSA